MITCSTIFSITFIDNKEYSFATQFTKNYILYIKKICIIYHLIGILRERFEKYILIAYCYLILRMGLIFWQPLTSIACVLLFHSWAPLVRIRIRIRVSIKGQAPKLAFFLNAASAWLHQHLTVTSEKSSYSCSINEFAIFAFGISATTVAATSFSK